MVSHIIHSDMPQPAPLPARKRLSKPGALSRLIAAGALRFSCDERAAADGAAFAELYTRSLQTALRMASWRNAHAEAELRALRASNTAMRANTTTRGDFVDTLTASTTSA